MSARLPVRAVLFDLDDTLQDREQAFFRYSADLVARMAERGDVQAARADDLLAFLRANDARGYRTRRDLFTECAARFSLGCGAASLCRDWTEHFGGFAVPEPGARALLDGLRGRARIGLVTNGEGPVQRAKLAAAGLADCFDALVISDEVGVEKPDARIFTLAAARLGAKPGECVMVGDHLEKDILGAEGAGMRAIWYSRFLPPQDGRTPLRTLTEVGRAIAALPACPDSI